jgi:hypothetical protein
MNKDKQKLIRATLEKNFTKSHHVKFFLTKGLKSFSNSLIVKSKSSIDQNKLEEIELILQKEVNDPAIELLLWIDTIGGLIPKSHIYKIPFFNTQDIKEHNPWRICPIGEYWVRRHDRQKKSLEDVDGHCRKNHTGKDLINSDEIEQIAKTQKFLNIAIKSQKKLQEYPDSNLYDGLIEGWTAYWNDQFKIDPPLTANLVKILIATESSFHPNGINPKNALKIGPARGLMQITIDTQKRLSGERKELKDHLIILSEDEIYDPNKNICAGIRWLFRKRETAKARLKHAPSWEDVLMEYKGKLKSNNLESKNIRKKIKRLIDELNEK